MVIGCTHHYLLPDKIYINIFIRLPQMATALPSRRSFSETTHTITNTIDHILNKGAEKLYDKYISAKIPNHLSDKFANFISVVFDPLTNTNQQHIHRKNEKPHQSVIAKIKLAKQAKMKKNSVKEQGKVRISQSRVGKPNIFKENSTKNTKNYDKSIQNKAETKYNAKSELKKLPNDGNDTNQSIELIIVDKAKRYNQEKQKIIQDQQLVQQSQKHKEQLQLQLHQLQQNGHIIAFDYDTGRALHPQPGKTQFQQHKPKKNIIFLKFQVQDEAERAKSSAPNEREVKNIRKITSYQRGRRSKHHQVNNQSYNNNGQRQYSTIPFIQIEQGVKMTETTSQKVAERPQTSRKPGTASTHRTFKSYTRERLQSIGNFKTIDVIASSGNTRYMGQSKQSKRTSLMTPKRSLLWSSRTCAKDHRISKNLQQFGAFFQFSGDAIE